MATVLSLDWSSLTTSSKSVSVCASTLSIDSAMKASRLYEVSNTLTRGAELMGAETLPCPCVRHAMRQFRRRDGGKHDEARAFERRLARPREIGFRGERRGEAEAFSDRQVLRRIVNPRRPPRVRERVDALTGPRFERGPAGLEFLLLQTGRGLPERRMRRRVHADGKPLSGKLPNMIRGHRREWIAGCGLHLARVRRCAALAVRQRANGVDRLFTSGAGD